MQQIHLSKEGYQKLLEEISYLQVERMEVVDKIKKYSENVKNGDEIELMELLNRRAEIDSRVSILNKMDLYKNIISTEFIDPDIVVLGSKVVLFDEEFGDTIEYKLLGTAEANPDRNIISDESPIGKTIMGKKKGDTFSYNAPLGTIKMKILDVQNT